MDEALLQELLGPGGNNDALIKALRAQQARGRLGQLTGDRVIAPQGAQLIDQANKATAIIGDQRLDKAREAARQNLAQQELGLRQKDLESRSQDRALSRTLAQARLGLGYDSLRQQKEIADARLQQAASRGGAGAKITEGERKAATLATRLKGSMQTLDEIEKRNAGAERPGVAEKVLGGLPLVGEIGANMARSTDRQIADAAQTDALDAALTLATGAAYTKEQLSGLKKSYFPQIGDSPATAASKKQKFQQVVQAAYEQAGNAQPTVDAALGDGPDAESDDDADDGGFQILSVE